MRADCVIRFFGINQPLDGQIQRVRAVERENKMLGPLPIEETAEPTPALENKRTGLDGFIVRAAPGWPSSVA